MDIDQIKGKLQNAFGKAEETVGEAIGSQDLSNAGAEDRLKGAATETWGNAKDTVREARDTTHAHATAAEERADEHGSSLRDRIATGAENLRDSINEKLDRTKEHERAERDDVRGTV